MEVEEHVEPSVPPFVVDKVSWVWMLDAGIVLGFCSGRIGRNFRQGRGIHNQQDGRRAALGASSIVSNGLSL